MKTTFIPLAFLIAAAASAETGAAPAHDFERESVLYVVPYSHLDTQWRWTYETTVDRYIRDTIDANLANFAKYPENVFTFTGSSRYRMMKEHYPADYEKVKALVLAGKWKVGGSSVDENDANCPSVESSIRQVLYGNRWFREEFGKDSIDYMLPDCFGFQAHLPSVWAHCGLKGFSTQKLVWSSAAGIPFTVGRWVGPDGRFVVAALDGTNYAGHVTRRIDTDPVFIKRMETAKKRSGVGVDYRYFGVGDTGGAPRAEDIDMTLRSVNNPDSRLKVVIAGSDQMFRDLPDSVVAKLPSYAGDLLLTEHSTGSLTSQAYCKRWNRMGEELAGAAETAAVIAGIESGMRYPYRELGEAWDRMLCTQMHDIIPGTSVPAAYEFSWNDQILSLNLAAGVIGAAEAEIVAKMDTRGPGIPLVVYNSLAQSRTDIVEAEVDFPESAPAHVRVSIAGKAVPTQVLSRSGKRVKIAFVAECAPLSHTVFHATASAEPTPGELKITDASLENAYYRVSINAAGDVASIIDKAAGNREMLAAPATLQFLYEKPAQWPAWNMDWADRQKPVSGVVDGPARVSIVENGPVRVTLEVSRKARDSEFVQRISLVAGEAGRRVEFRNLIDWQSRECSLKAAFPLSVAAKTATYNLGLGAIARGNNDPKKFEVPSREWFDLTAEDRSYGVSVLEDSKFGSDKPTDNTVRLTLLYTPGVRSGFLDQGTQDWGRHDIRYALFGHTGDWRNGTEQQARGFNRPLLVFSTTAHDGPLGASHSLASVEDPGVALRTIKRAEDSPEITIVRLQELHGSAHDRVPVKFARAISDAWEVDGQERRIGPARFSGDKLFADFGIWSPKSYAVKFAPTPAAAATRGAPLALEFNADVVSHDADRKDGAMNASGLAYSAEVFPTSVRYSDIDYKLGPVTPGAKNAMACDGRTLRIPAKAGAKTHVLFAADERVEATFRVNGKPVAATVPAWTGFIGQWDNRRWDRKFATLDCTCNGYVTGFDSGYIRREPVAWFGRHIHSPKKNDSYRFGYLFAQTFPTGDLTLPNDPRVKIFAITTEENPAPAVVPAAPIYEELPEGTPPPVLRASVAKDKLTQDMPESGISMVDRSETPETLSIGKPSAEDRGEARFGAKVTVIPPPKAYRPSKEAGITPDNAAPRLNDGRWAKNETDEAMTTWVDTYLDGGPRYLMDLGSSVSIKRINTYTAGEDMRGPQSYTLWAANGDTMPAADFTQGKGSGWTLVARSDSGPKGPGGCHGSTVVAKSGGAIGPFRWLLWIPTPSREGTAFTEFDVIEAK